MFSLKYIRKCLELPISAILSNIHPQNKFGLNNLFSSTKFVNDKLSHEMHLKPLKMKI